MNKKVKKEKAALHGHDGFFKKAMSRKRVAKEFLETHLPDEIRKKIDLESVEKQDSQFLSNILGKGISDVLYKGKFDGKEGYISIIIEHQSTPDYFMTLRIQQYILRLCEEHKRRNKMKKGDKFPLVYPIIFYTGKGKYTVPKSFYELFEDPQLAKELITQDTKVIDVNEIEDIELREKYYSGIMTYLMKHIYEKEMNPYLLAISEIFRIISIEDFKYLEDMIYYILERGNSKKSKETLLILQEIVSEDKKDNIMTIIEQLTGKRKGEWMEIGKQEGRMEGIEKGRMEGKIEGITNEKLAIARKMLLEGISDKNMIAKITGLTLSEIEKLI